MANLENAARRIIGVRSNAAGPLLFCEAGELSPVVGDWVMVGQDAEVFPAVVALPDTLVETHLLQGVLPLLLRLAGEAELATAGIPWAVEAAVSRRFEELSASHRWPYLLKEVEARPDRLIVRFSAAQEPGGPEYVSLLKALAGILPVKIELYLVSEDVSPVRPPRNEKFAGWVNSLLKPLDPVVMANAAIGEPLLDESEVYRPTNKHAERTFERPAQHFPPSEAEEKPVASYDPATAKFWPEGVELASFDRGDH